MNKKTIAIAVAIFLAGGLGTAVGSAGAAEPKTNTVIKTVPGPERIVTKTVQGPEVVKTIKITPEACTNALDLAEENFGYASDGLKGASRALTAVGNFDVAGVTAAGKDIDAASSKLKVEEYNTAAAACRSAK